MAVSVHYVETGLVWVDATGNVLDKNDPAVKLSDFTKGALRQEHRVFPNLVGPGSTPSSAGFPTIKEYLAAEAALNYAFAYMDQTKIITQMIV